MEMQIVFSRKGFDSAAGRCPSPVIDGRPISLPIPTRMPTALRYEDLQGNIGELVQDLTRDRIAASNPCHLDPDVDASALQRLAGWRGAFGQIGAAQAHLHNNKIAPGDLFLFWGLFRPAERNGRWTFNGPREHRLFGWLQVGEIVDLGPDGSHALDARPWLKDHPHVREGWGRTNTLYVAAERLLLGEQELGLPGWGTFSRGFRLTVPGSAGPSHWMVPDWLNPARGGVGMTYHAPERWSSDGTLRSAARGQEFVAKIDGRSDARAWLMQLFTERT